MWAFQSCFAASFFAFTYRKSALHFHYTFITCAIICPLTAHLTVVEVFIYETRACSLVFIRTPPLRYDSGIVWAGSGEPAPRPLTALRGPCCPSCARWRSYSSSPSPRPLPRHEKTQQLDLDQVTPHTATLTHSPLCAAEFNNSGWLASLEIHLLFIQPIKAYFYSNGESIHNSTFKNDHSRVFFLRPICSIFFTILFFLNIPLF